MAQYRGRRCSSLYRGATLALMTAFSPRGRPRLSSTAPSIRHHSDIKGFPPRNVVSRQVAAGHGRSAVKQSPAMAVKPFPLELTGASNRRYYVEKVLHKREVGQEIHSVYLASAGGQNCVLKQVPGATFEISEKRYHDLLGCTNLRLLEDTIPEISALVHKYRTGNLQNLVRDEEEINESTKKRILRDALQGLATLHDRDIAHVDLKPDNILLDWTRDESNTIVVSNVELADLEGSIHLGKNMAVRNIPVSHPLWGSPEAQIKSCTSLPADMFSFGLVCIFTLFKSTPLAYEMRPTCPDHEIYKAVSNTLQLFWDPRSYDGLLEYFNGNDPTGAWMLDFAKSDLVERKEPMIGYWELPWVKDRDIKDLLKKMTSLDPRRRITARRCLNHRWFREA